MVTTASNSFSSSSSLLAACCCCRRRRKKAEEWRKRERERGEKERGWSGVVPPTRQFWDLLLCVEFWPVVWLHSSVAFRPSGWQHAFRAASRFPLSQFLLYSPYFPPCVVVVVVPAIQLTDQGRLGTQAEKKKKKNELVKTAILTQTRSTNWPAWNVTSRRQKVLCGAAARFMCRTGGTKGKQEASASTGVLSVTSVAAMNEGGGDSRWLSFFFHPGNRKKRDKQFIVSA